MRTLFLTVALSLPIYFSAIAENPIEIDKGEYFIDVDLGVGSANALKMTSGANSYTLPLENITPGAHIFGVRALDQSGHWTPTLTRPLYITDEILYSDMEYFVDQDPGNGNGVSVNHGHSRRVQFNVSTDNISVGAHTLSVRILDSQGKWGEVMTVQFIVTQKTPETDLVLEYFYDRDPGVGVARRVAVSEGENIFYLPLDSDLEADSHILGVRCMDKTGNWSRTVVNPLYIVDKIDLLDAEYYVDEDPGEGKANKVAIGENITSSFVINTDNLSLGKHQLVMRALHENGWTTLFSRPFEILSESSVNEIEWKLGFSYKKSSSGIKLESYDIPDGSHVAVIAINGTILAEDVWKDSTQPLYMDFNYPGVVILYIITPDKEYSVKMVNR